MRSLILFLLAFSVLPLQAAEASVSPADTLLEQVTPVENALESNTLGVGKLSNITRQLGAMKSTASDCVTEYETVVAEKKKALTALGEKLKKEPAEVAKQRKQQEAELAAAESTLAGCNAMLLRIQSALDLADSQLQSRLAEKLLAHNDDIFQVISKHQDVPVSWIQEIWQYSKEHGWLHQAPEEHLWLILIIIVVSIVLGAMIRRYLSPPIQRVHWTNMFSGRLFSSLLASFVHDAPYILGSIAMAASLTIVTRDMEVQSFSVAFSYGLVFLFVARFLIRTSLCPPAPGKLFLAIDPDIARDLARRFNILLLIIFAGYLLVDTIIGTSLPGYAMSLARTVVRILFAVNLIWILWLFRHLRGMPGQGWFRFGFSLVLVCAVIVDLLGYTNLAGWLLRSVFGSFLAIGIIMMTLRLASELLEGLEYGRTPLMRKLRHLIGLTPDGHITGFFWFRLLVLVGLWAALALMLILIWDISTSVVEQIRLTFVEGFTIGSLTVVPARIMLALMSLGILVTISAWFQGQLKRHWLNRVPMERGAREALVTMVGYIGVAIAIIVALGVAGINYANLAIIAGALSVGIGFGLQNVVNNFVSGLILLFERPIKTGDWIVVGDTEGYVKRIRIRATQIQTFDRADVIVPNSELISSQVTNWMLHDMRGRARIPVGVAYGSDTGKVKDLLLKVAFDHDDVIQDGSAPEPYVLFKEFGDSSLNFELRCYVKDIDRRLRVISDLNFAIDTIFRENGITIPFPQRDVHLLDVPGELRKE